MRRLELGSGMRPAAGFEHLDANPAAPHVEYVCSAFDPLPFADGEFDELRAVDLLEHGFYKHVERTLAEWARIVKPGAPFFCQVPSGATIMQMYVEHDDRLLSVPDDLPKTYLMGAQWRLLGSGEDPKFIGASDDWRLNVHGTIFSRASLGLALQVAGFEIERIDENPHPNLQAYCRKEGG